MKTGLKRVGKYIFLFTVSVVILVITATYFYKSYQKNRSYSLHYLGMEEKKAGDYLKAIKLLSMSIEAYPKDYVPYLTLASCFEELGNIDLAVEEYETAYKLIENSDDKIALHDLKLLKYKLRKLKKVY